MYLNVSKFDEELGNIWKIRIYSSYRNWISKEFT